MRGVSRNFPACVLAGGADHAMVAGGGSKVIWVAGGPGHIFSSWPSLGD
jgi:hypothetical protein